MVTPVRVMGQDFVQADECGADAHLLTFVMWRAARRYG